MIDTHAANLAAEQRIREALGTGVRRDEWPPPQTFWRWVIGTALAGAAFGIFLAWLLYP